MVNKMVGEKVQLKKEAGGGEKGTLVVFTQNTNSVVRHKIQSDLFLSSDYFFVSSGIILNKIRVSCEQAFKLEIAAPTDVVALNGAVPGAAGGRRVRQVWRRRSAEERAGRTSSTPSASSSSPGVDFMNFICNGKLVIGGQMHIL
jgi:hypothetical protein